MPLLFVRMLYLSLDILGNKPRLSASSGDVTILLCMGFLEEMTVVTAHLSLGFKMWMTLKEELEQAVEADALVELASSEAPSRRGVERA